MLESRDADGIYVDLFVVFAKYIIFMDFMYMNIIELAVFTYAYAMHYTN